MNWCPGRHCHAVADGGVGAAWAGAGWFAGTDSAFNMFSSVPFGPGIGEYMAWMYEGGGLEMAREMFHSRGAQHPCGLIPPEASGWFRKEIQTVADLEGAADALLRAWRPGDGRSMGVSPTSMPPGEILEAMQDGVLDAAEFSLPAMDLPLGFTTWRNTTSFPAGTSRRHSSISTST